MKKIAIALMAVVFLLLIVVVLVTAQAKIPPEGGTPNAAPNLKTEDLLKIRELQYQQAKRALEMNEIEKRYALLQKQSDAWKDEMHAAIAAGAKAARVDLQKWDFDTDKLTFIPKPAPVPTAVPAPK
jgi:hypothetical protein